MATPTRKKAAGYHGVENMAFAPKKDGAYDTTLMKLKYAQSINPSALLDSAEQYADDRLVIRLPNDKGYEGEIGTTAQDPELDKAAGFAFEGEGGLITTNAVRYLRGALYYEYRETDEDGVDSMVKVWMLNTEIGKGAATHTTDKSSLEFGSYTYPIHVYGDPLMDSTGSAEYRDDRGLPRTAYMVCARPEDEGYADFGKTVPTPKVAAAT